MYYKRPKVSLIREKVSQSIFHPLDVLSSECRGLQVAVGDDYAYDDDRLLTSVRRLAAVSATGAAVASAADFTLWVADVSFYEQSPHAPQPTPF